MANSSLSSRIKKVYKEQAGAELGQAQLKLGLDFNSINRNLISLIVLVELTNFPFYIFLIRLKISELATASYC